MKLNQQHIPFTMVANEVLYRTDLSMRAKCMFAYLFSKPDDWDFSGDRIVKEMKENRKAVYTTLKELVDNGLLTRKRQSNGRNEYIIQYASISEKEILKHQNPLDLFCHMPKVPLAKKGSISNMYSPSKKEKENKKYVRDSIKRIGRTMKVDK